MTGFDRNEQTLRLPQSERRRIGSLHVRRSPTFPTVEPPGELQLPLQGRRTSIVDTWAVMPSAPGQGLCSP